MISVAARTKQSTAQWRLANAELAADIRCHLPGIVTAFDPSALTCSVTPALLERILIDGVVSDVELPELHDVPVMFPRAGGFSLTLPVTVGDECLLEFSDLCIDTWFETGGIQRTPKDFDFRHAIGDAVAHFGLSSKGRPLANYSTTSAQLRSDDGTVVIDLTPGRMTLSAPAVTVQSSDANSLPLVNSSFYEWFTGVYMPQVRYLTVPPTVPPAPLTTVLRGE